MATRKLFSPGQSQTATRKDDSRQSSGGQTAALRPAAHSMQVGLESRHQSFHAEMLPSQIRNDWIISDRGVEINTSHTPLQSPMLTDLLVYTRVGNRSGAFVDVEKLCRCPLTVGYRVLDGLGLHADGLCLCVCAGSGWGEAGGKCALAWDRLIGNLGQKKKLKDGADDSYMEWTGFMHSKGSVPAPTSSLW